MTSESGAEPRPYAFGPGLADRIRTNLAGFARRPVRSGNRVRAAVALTVVGDDSGEACFVLTRRASTLSAHPGQWALPGGRVDRCETAEEAARREVLEEVGLTLDDPGLGALDDYATRSGYVITPFVYWGGATPVLTANPAEVESIHFVPLAQLDRPDAPTFETIPESDRPVIRMPMRDRRLYAPLAAFLYQFREVALHGRDVRIDRLEQPLFAWK